MAKNVDTISKKTKSTSKSEAPDMPEETVEVAATPEVETPTTEATPSEEPATEAAAEVATETPVAEPSEAPAEATPTPETTAVPEPNLTDNSIPVPTAAVPEPNVTDNSIPVPTVNLNDNSIPVPTVSAAGAAQSATADGDTFESLFPEPTVALEGPPIWIWWILLVIGAGVLIFVVYSITQQPNSWIQVVPGNTTETASPTTSTEPSATVATTDTPTATPTPAETITPTPAPEVITLPASEVTLRVLNGTTKVGAAAAMKTTLQSSGYTVRTIGNANNQNYTATYVYYQTGKEQEAQAVAAATGKANVQVQQSTLANPDMILVVVGP